MPDAVKLLQQKFVLMKAVPLVFTILFFLMIAPIEQLDFIRNVDPVIIFSSVLLFIVGIVFIIEFFRNLPDAGNHTGAKTGAGVFLIMGIVTFLYGFATLFGFYEPFASAGNTEIANFGLTILLGASSIILYVGIHPEIFHHKTLAKHIKASV